MATIKGVWVFNEQPDFSSYAPYASVKFISNDNSYVGMTQATHPLYYAMEDGFEEPVHTGDQWFDEAYRIVDFGTTAQEVPDDFYNWFTSNATKFLTEPTIDTSWYNDTDTEFNISTKAQLLGFVELSKTNTFEGKTIRLTRDIKFNTGKAEDWLEKPPANIWYPIAPDSNVLFKGCFDGQGHVIAGLYNKSAAATLGLFAYIAGATIKNVCLTNSYFCNNTTSNYHTHTGAVVGSAFGGIVENIYSDAILQGGHNIGLVGFFRNYNLTIKNCWFDGLIMPNNDVEFMAGGLLGLGFYAGTNSTLNGGLTLENCLFTGRLSGGTNGETSAYAGGLVGMAPTGTENTEEDKTFIRNCIVCGTIDTQANGVAGVFGTCSWRTKYTTLENVYVSEDAYVNTDGVSQAIPPSRADTKYINGAVTLLSKDKFLGEAARENASGLDYDTTWKIVENNIPELRTVTKTPYNEVFTIDYSTIIDIVDKVRELSGTDKAFTALELLQGIDDVYSAGKNSATLT